MALVTTKELFQKAYAGGYAIGSFNFNNMETVQAISEACREEYSPVILQVSQDVLENHTYYQKLVEAALSECADIPIAWHLDHGSSFEICTTTARLVGQQTLGQINIAKSGLCAYFYTHR